MTQDLFYCEHCNSEVDIKNLDEELGLCHACLATLRVDFKNAKEKPANKYKIKLHD